MRNSAILAGLLLSSVCAVFKVSHTHADADVAEAVVGIWCCVLRSWNPIFSGAELQAIRPLSLDASYSSRLLSRPRETTWAWS